MGFELKCDGGIQVGWAEFELPAPGARLGINLIREGVAAFRMGSGTLSMEVEELDSCLAYLKKKGIETSEIIDVPNMISYFNIKDTEGNPIQFVTEPRVKTE
jgi:hypothetical protein